MEEERSVSELVSDITEFNDMKEILQDKDVDEAMDIVIKLIAKPNVPPGTAAALVVQVQALSAKFALLAKYYMIYKKDGEEAKNKKNTFMTLTAELEKLANALKYLAKG